MTTINNGQLNNLKNLKSFTPILQFKSYITADNLKLDYFKLSDRAHFCANKRGLLLHGLNCSECDFHKVTKNFIFIENNLQAYDQGHTNLKDTKITKEGSKVTFADKNMSRHEKSCKTLEVSSFWIKLQLANYYCCSLQELACLNS